MRVVLRVLAILLGGAAGVVCAIVLIRTEGALSGQDLARLFAPLVRVLSFVTGWPNASEMSIVLHLLAIAVVFAAAGMIAGGLLTRRLAR